MFESNSNSKSSLTLLTVISCLVISTLVVVSYYFFRPNLELDIKNQIISKLNSYDVMNAVIDVNGRDVILKGITSNSLEARKIETEIQNISGVNLLESKLLIKNIPKSIPAD